MPQVVHPESFLESIRRKTGLLGPGELQPRIQHQDVDWRGAGGGGERAHGGQGGEVALGGREEGLGIGVGGGDGRSGGLGRAGAVEGRRTSGKEGKGNKTGNTENI